MHLSENLKLVWRPTKKVSEKTTPEENSSEIHYAKWTVMFLISFFLAALVVSGTILVTQQMNEEHEYIIVAEANQLVFEENPQIIDRTQWGARPPSTSIKPLSHPIDLVVVAHTVTPFCTTVRQCSRIVASIQNYHQEQRQSPDIAYNFLIGGDGNVYVGRGWDLNNPIKNESIAIGLIGNYLHDTLNSEMADAVHMLLLQGVEMGKLTEKYRIVCHNQVSSTLSPGGKACNVIKTWQHYSAKKIH